MLNALSKRIVAAVLTITLVVVCTALAEETPAATATPEGVKSADDWKFGFELYGFLPTISATAAYGGDSATGSSTSTWWEDTATWHGNLPAITSSTTSV